MHNSKPFPNLPAFGWAKAAMVCGAVGLAGCTSTDVPIPPSSAGYQSIVFNQYTKIRDHALNIYSFNAGTRLIADRQTRGGRTLYCGLVNINDDTRPLNGCFGFEAPSTLIIGVDAGFKEVRRPQPAGTIKLDNQRL